MLYSLVYDITYLVLSYYLFKLVVYTFLFWIIDFYSDIIWTYDEFYRLIGYDIGFGINYYDY